MLLEKLFIPVGACLQMTAADFTPEGVVVDLRTTAESADCPSCSMRAQRVHSHSQRRLADLPLAHTPVRVQLHLRRFRCDTLDCSRTTFSEPIAALAKPYARRTARLQAEQRQISLDVGAEPGARLARRQGMPVSPDTLLRLARREPPDVLSTPRHLGIDDFALRKGQVYGTILVDLQAHRPVDLLEQRSAEVVEQWLKAHPGVEVITRDRSNDYAEGASRGAPDAVQVADRFHLLTNLREMLQRLLDGQQQALAQATREPCSEPEDALAPAAQPSLPEEEKAVALLASACVSQARLEPQAHEPTPLPQLSKAAECSQRRRERRYERYTAVRELREQGLSLRAIAAHLGVSRRTVRQFASAEQFPERASRPAVRSKLDPFSAYLSQQLAAGEDNAMQLWRELGEQGYSGSRALVSRWVAQHRQLVPKPDVTVAHKRGRGRPPAPVFRSAASSATALVGAQGSLAAGASRRRIGGGRTAGGPTPLPPRSQCGYSLPSGTGLHPNGAPTPG